MLLDKEMFCRSFITHLETIKLLRRPLITDFKEPQPTNQKPLPVVSSGSVRSCWCVELFPLSRQQLEDVVLH